MIPSIFKRTISPWKGKTEAVYTLVAYPLSLQTLVCVCAFRLQGKTECR